MKKEDNGKPERSEQQTNFEKTIIFCSLKEEKRREKSTKAFETVFAGGLQAGYLRQQ